jgi:prepilin signal peptidase PulO-like enzyme (type II secretory pathway)
MSNLEKAPLKTIWVATTVMFGVFFVIAGVVVVVWG